MALLGAWNILTVSTVKCMFFFSTKNDFSVRWQRISDKMILTLYRVNFLANHASTDRVAHFRSPYSVALAKSK